MTDVQVEKLTDQLKRSLAEMENVRMRAARDVDVAKRFAVQVWVANDHVHAKSPALSLYGTWMSCFSSAHMSSVHS